MCVLCVRARVVYVCVRACDREAYWVEERGVRVRVRARVREAYWVEERGDERILARGPT